MTKGLSLLILLLSIVNTGVFANEDTTKVKKATYVITNDDPIVKALDHMVARKYFNANPFVCDTQQLNIKGFCADTVPIYSDEVLAERLRVLDEKTPFNLTYNEHVRGFINLYANRRREMTSRLLGLSHVYFPMFEEALERNGLPLEFKYLAVVESALKPTARSKSGAVGLWQFMYPTGKIYGLEVSSYIDERMDPYKATQAACDYFKFLYGLYGNYELVMAAYNCGPGNVNKAIRKSGGKKTYWELWPYLPKETRGYVPAFIAVNYVMNHPSEHNLYPMDPITTFFDNDTVYVDDAVKFETLSSSLGIPIEELRYLNPTYKLDYIPNTAEKQLLYLPKDRIGLYLSNETIVQQIEQESILKDTGAEQQVTEQVAVVENVRKMHVVKKGEYLGSIANKYGCSVNDIKDWNGLRGTKLNPGQKLTVYVAANSTPSETAKKPTGSDSYTVQPGDTLWQVSRNTGIPLDKLKELNEGINHNALKPGMKLRIGG